MPHSTGRGDAKLVDRAMGPWIWGPIEITQGPIRPILLTYTFHVIYFL
jgi:hypothetical protein